jgi:hypothetical protein
MSVINTQPLIGASGNQGGAYNLERSLRFRSSASAYLNRTPASAGNRQKWTWSGWVKRGTLGGLQQLFSATAASPTDDTNLFGLAFDTNDCLISGGAGTTFLTTTQVFRDLSAWYHIVAAFDTTQATASNRIKFYVNGVQVTSFSTTNYTTLNLQTAVNNTVQHDIGSLLPFLTRYFDGYITEVNFVDGQQLDATSFGENDTITGVWKPKRYAGTYGTNGFYLPFTDVATTSGSNAGLGKDFSGNGNYYTTNNISVTAGATYDSMTDVPTLTSATAANYCVLNPLLQNNWWAAVSRGPITNANLTQANSAGTANFATFDLSSNRGKWYYELNCAATDAQNAIVIAARARATFEVDYYQNGNKQTNGTTPVAYGATWTSGDVIGVAIDVPNGTFTFYKNNVSQGTITNAVPTDQPVYIGGYFNSASGTYNYNFGQRPFAYTPPSGFVALNTFNLPDSTIKAGNKVMDATTYTGTGSALSVVNAGGFKPDMVWIKARSQAYFNNLNDSVRGTNRRLFSNTTDAEDTTTNCLTAFDSNGFTVGTNTGINQSGTTHVAWQWQAGQGSTSSNTSGTITSTVSVNATAGFSIVTYTGNLTSGATVGHGLGVAPAMIIAKRRNAANGWPVYHKSMNPTQNMWLELGNAATLNASFNSANPTSTTFALGANNDSNASGGTYVAYCWSEIEGFSKFGSYVGNGSTDGPFVYTGFRPKFILTKRTDATSDWWIQDTARSPRNASNALLFPNLANAEYTTAGVEFDILSNGFKPRNTGHNVSGGTYIYMAFAENPFKNSLAR